VNRGFEKTKDGWNGGGGLTGGGGEGFKEGLKEGFTEKFKLRET